MCIYDSRMGNIISIIRCNLVIINKFITKYDRINNIRYKKYPSMYIINTLYRIMDDIKVNTFTIYIYFYFIYASLFYI